MKFSCSSCGQHIAVEGAPAGAEFNCPNCGQLLRIPAPIEAADLEPPKLALRPRESRGAESAPGTAPADFTGASAASASTEADAGEPEAVPARMDFREALRHVIGIWFGRFWLWWGLALLAGLARFLLQRAGHQIPAWAHWPIYEAVGILVSVPIILAAVEEARGGAAGVFDSYAEAIPRLPFALPTIILQHVFLALPLAPFLFLLLQGREGASNLSAQSQTQGRLNVDILELLKAALGGHELLALLLAAGIAGSLVVWIHVLFAPAAAVADRAGPIEAFRISWRLVQGQRLRLLCLFLTLFVLPVIGLVGILLALMAGGSMLLLLVGLLAIPLTLIVGPWFAALPFIASAVLYVEADRLRPEVRRGSSAREQTSGGMALAFTLVGIVAGIGLAVFFLSSPPGVRKADEPTGNSNSNIESKPAVVVTANTPEAVARAYLEAGQQRNEARELALVTERVRTTFGGYTMNPARDGPAANIEIIRVGKDDRDRTYVLAGLRSQGVPRGMPKVSTKAVRPTMVKACVLIMRQESGQWQIHAVVMDAKENSNNVEWDMETGQTRPFRLPKAGG